MKADKVFFEANSVNSLKLTNTSANHIANMAKEHYETLQTELDSVQFFTKKLSLLGGPVERTISKGISTLDWVEDNLIEISKCKSLIAWLREGIKAKERLCREIEGTSFSEWAEANNVVLPTEPNRKEIPTEDDYYSQLPLKDRNTYYHLETKVAVLGKYLHPNGSFSSAKSKLKHYLANPTSVVGDGRDCMIYTYEPTMTTEEVDDKFFDLQAKHRDLQAQLNSIKFKCEKFISDATAAINKEYSEEYEKYATEKKALYAKYTTWKHDELVKTKDLKIIIPDALIPIYQVITSLGKK